jgi:hypothetical protein
MLEVDTRAADGCQGLDMMNRDKNPAEMMISARCVGTIVDSATEMLDKRQSS